MSRTIESSTPPHITDTILETPAMMRNVMTRRQFVFGGAAMASAVVELALVDDTVKKIGQMNSRETARKLKGDVLLNALGQIAVAVPLLASMAIISVLAEQKTKINAGDTSGIQPRVLNNRRDRRIF